MSRKLIVFLLGLSLLIGCSGIAIAQEEKKEETEKPGSIAQVWYFKVKPQNVLQFEAALKEHIAWQKNKEAIWGWNVFQTITGPDYGEYIIRSHNYHWQDFDANMKFFEKQVMLFRLQVLPLVESIDCRIMQVDFENSKWPEEESQANLIEVYKYYVKPSMFNQFNDTRKQLHEAFVQANWDVYYAWSFVRSGGVVPSAYLIVPHANWAGFKDPEKSFMEVLTEVYGEEKAEEITANFRASIMKIKSFAVMYRPELSYKPNM